MAKPFYSLEEACRRLGKDEAAVRGLVREGKLREFRDAGKVFFKAEDVESLAGGGPQEVALEPAVEELPTLAEETGSGGTSVIGLAPVEEDETAKRKKEDTVITASGIGVFDDDELEIDADPMAKTQITTGATGDQVSLEGTGSGSGLLDLTREADDTSLGAELLDEIYPGEEEAPARSGMRAVPAAARSATPVPAPPAEEAVEEAEPQEAAAPVAVLERVVGPVAVDPMEGLFGGLLVGTAILLVLAGSVVAGVLQGFLPDYARFLSARFWLFLGGAALVAVLAGLVGVLIGRTAAPRR